jgi:DNA-binding MarR family transcriptional regulator
MSRNLGANATAWLKSSQPELVIGYLLKTLHHGLRQALNDALRERRVGLSFAQGATLFELYFEPGLTGAQLARRAPVSAQTMNSMLRNLEALSFIERRPHPESRRADSWFLTGRGADEVAQARVTGDAVFRRMLSALNAEEIGNFQSYLRRCIDALEADGAERDTQAEVGSALSTAAPHAPRRAARHRAAHHAAARGKPRRAKQRTKLSTSR